MPNRTDFQTRRARGRTGALLAALTVVLATTSASAYTISNELSDGCHERITSSALRAARGDLPAAHPLPPSNDEQALIDDLEFVPDGDMRDLGGATLLAAVRDNDLKGRASDDLSALAEVHGDPNGQQEHCLRAQEQDEPGGTKAAVDACRAFIRERALTAIAGLDANGMPDPGKRITLTINLALRGTVDAPLPTYYVAAGQALHAIEDSFTHTYRTPDAMQITVALNWIDEVNNNLVESRDGPGHAKDLDRCDDPDELRKTRRLLAIDAATAFLRATLDATKTQDEKMAAVDALLDKYIGYSAGCTFDNRWCNAPERQYKDPTGCTCNLGSARGGLGGLFGGGALVALALARRARRRRRSTYAAIALGVLGAVCFGGTDAHAETAPPTTTTVVKPAQPATSSAAATAATTTVTTTTPAPNPATEATTTTVVVTPQTTTTTVTSPTDGTKNAPPPPTVVVVPQPGPTDPSQLAFGGYAGASGSVSKPAAAVAVGLRLRVSKQWAFGLDGEWNPWIAFNGSTIRKGAANVYGTAMLRFPLAYENFNVRMGASLGVSSLLIPLYGAPQGSTGVYFGIAPLALEWKLSRSLYLIINPLNVAIPVPQLKGVPLLYPQYRTSIGFEVYAG